MKKRLCVMLAAAIAVSTTWATDIYLRGNHASSWGADESWKFSTQDGDTYVLKGKSLSASNEWKIADANWRDVNYGGVTGIAVNTATELTNGTNANCSLAADFDYGTSGQIIFKLSTGTITFWDGVSDIGGGSSPCTGTLPILHINIYNTDASGSTLVDDNGVPVDDSGYPSSSATLNNEVIAYDLADKDYRPGYYWLEIPDGCTYATTEGFKAIGSQEKPLPLEMKARGNWTRTGFAKKPFKLKLGKKQDMLGLTSSKSKHYAILAHADDNCGFLRNFVGFNLGKRMGLPWTPGMQPVEVIINGDYRGLYFLTESIRVGDGRIDIEELDDEATSRADLSGGYLVELDNYDGDNQIQMDEAYCSS